VLTFIGQKRIGAMLVEVTEEEVVVVLAHHQQKRETRMQTEYKPDIEAAKNLDGIKHRLVVMSGKGGVGKSTVASNLAVALSLKGYEVGLLDVDIHGPSIPKMLGLGGRRITGEDGGLLPVFAMPNLIVMSIGFLLREDDAPIIWRGPLKMGAIRQFLEEVKWGDLDYLIVDLPPGTGDEPLSVAQLLPQIDGVIIVTTPQDVALLSVRKSINFARKLNMPLIGLVENMSEFVCPHCGKSTHIFKTGGGQKACKDLSVPFLGCIPIDAEIVECGDSGKPFVLEHGDAPSAKAFNQIVDRIEEYINLKEKQKRKEKT
jgi:ATP-binding protein involved in chromosome partitioning